MAVEVKIVGCSDNMLARLQETNDIDVHLFLYAWKRKHPSPQHAVGIHGEDGFFVGVRRNLDANRRAANQFTSIATDLVVAVAHDSYHFELRSTQELA